MDDKLTGEIVNPENPRIATGPNAGQRVPMAGIEIADHDRQAPTGPRCANVGGFSLHANVAVGSADRAGLERLCRYAGRAPPIAGPASPGDPQLDWA